MMIRRPRLSSRRKIGAEAAGKEKSSNHHHDPNVRPILIKEESGGDHNRHNDSERSASSLTGMTASSNHDSDGVTTSRRAGRNKSTSSVSFETVTVLEFGYEWGDHPFTTEGVPLSLSWEPFDEKCFEVDAYERMRTSPPGFHGNQLSSQQRRDILIRAGYDPSIVLHAEMELDEERRRQRNNVSMRREEERRRHRQRRFVKDLCSLRFGVSASSSYRTRINNNNSRHGTSSRVIAAASTVSAR